jgi:hypothetical protein
MHTIITAALLWQYLQTELILCISLILHTEDNSIIMKLKKNVFIK